MAAGGFLNGVRFTANAGGTGDFVVSSAVQGFQTPADDSAVNGTVYSYRAESTDLTEWENGEGAYTTGTTTLARTTIHDSSNAGAKVNFTAAPQVAITAFKADLLAKGNNLSDLPSASTAFGNIKQAATASATGVVKRQRLSYIREEQTSGTNGGTFTSGADQTRTLNTETDPDAITSVASNQFTISAAGTYKIEWWAPAYACDRHQSFLYNVTDTAEVQRGSSEFNAATDSVQNDSHGLAIVTIAASKTFEIRHRCSTTSATTGFGNAASFGIEVYTRVFVTSYDQ